MNRIDRLCAAALALFAASAIDASAASPLSDDVLQSPGCVQWVDSVYDALTPRQRVAQLVFPKVAPDGGQQARAAIRRHVAGDGVGGLLFSKGSLAQYVEMVNYAQSLAAVPLMMTFDGEWGLSMRIPEATRFPKNMALGAVGNPRLLYDYGREMARQCSLLGVHVNFAPVMDVNSNPANPVIGIRSYGEDPARVARLGTAYSLGLEDGGVMAVAKHFPGHGDTSTDSHKARTVVTHSAALLDSVDLVPFRSFIDAGCSGVMTGHIVLPAIDASGLPASLSPAVSTGMLRDRLGFGGLVFTDALEMKGASIEGRNNAVAALAAGADVLETPRNASGDIDAILAAVADGSLPARRVEESCRRVLAYKYALGLRGRVGPVALPGLKDKICAPEAEAVNRRLTAATMTVLKNDGGILPLAGLEKKKIAVVSIGAPKSDVFARFCAKYAPCKFISVAPEGLTAQQRKDLEDCDVVVAAVYGSKPWMKSALNSISSLSSLSSLSSPSSASGSLVSVFFTSPYALSGFASDYRRSGAVLLAYEDTPLACEYAAQTLFGGIAADGRLPVNVAGIAPAGSGLSTAKTRLGYSTPLCRGLRPEMEDSLDAAVRSLIDRRGMPGCQLLVAKGGDVVYDKCFGVTAAGGPEVTPSTVYDLASVSKAAGTLPGLMKAYDDGLYRLDAFMSDYVPGLRRPLKDSIRVREFLFHESGFPASLDMFTIMIDTASYSGRLITSRPDKKHSIKISRRSYGSNTARLRRDITAPEATESFPIEAARGVYVGQVTLDSIMERIYDAKLRPTRKYNYSCLNFCLLMDMEQRLTGVPHDRYVTDSIFAPLGAWHTSYRPAQHHAAGEAAPTEKDAFLRRQLLKGYVHDELCAFSGGVQGNAGLFSNAADIARFSQMLLNGGTYGGHRFFSEPTVELFTKTKSPTCRRGLGFDRPDTDNPDASPTCARAGGAVFGHTGFTGTVFWVDPANDLIFVFLTNRVNPTRDNDVFRKSNIRSDLFRMVCEAMTE